MTKYSCRKTPALLNANNAGFFVLAKITTAAELVLVLSFPSPIMPAEEWLSLDEVIP